MKDTLTPKDLLKLTIHRFRNERTAHRFTEDSGSIMMVFLGDDGGYWAVNMEDATHLLRAGYEAVPRR